MKMIQLVGVGAQAEASNASVTPGFPVGAGFGDTVLILASIRNSGAGIPLTPLGWKTLLLSGNVGLFARMLVRGDSVATLPTIAFAGGVANATTIARAYAIRYNNPNVDLLVSASADQLNGSAQNIATPALTVTENGNLLLHVGWKQGVWTTVTPPAGDASLAEFSSALGSGSAQILSGFVQGAAANAGASSYVATGGAANISRGATLALRPYVTTWTTIGTGSAPCDFPTAFNAVSNAACTALAAINATVDLLTNVTAVRTSVTSGVVTVLNAVPFSSVDIDPRGVADLVSDPYSVKADRAGIWAHGHDMNPAFSGTEGNMVRISPGSDSGRSIAVRDFNSTRNPSSGGGTGGTSTMSESFPSPSNPFRLSTEVSITGAGAPANPTIIRGFMFMFRVSD